MAVSRLILTDFRSYEALRVDADTGLVVLTGDNGAGKTNILEALSLLSPGRGLRGAPLGEMARTQGAGGFAVAGHLENGIEIGTGVRPDAPERRQVRINGAPAVAGAMGESLSLLWLTPAMDRLFVDSPGGRRRFLDRLVLALEPGHGLHAARYEAAMRERNKLLSEPSRADPAWLDALEAAMAEHGFMIDSARRRTLAALRESIQRQTNGLFAKAEVALEGWQSDDDLAAMLRQSRPRDTAAGRALAGPHRTDLAVIHLGKGQPAALCSTGEQKALLLGIVLAHADIVGEGRGQRPVLLLDEIAAHLDPSRRAALFERLHAAGGQVWMTGTEPALFADAPSGTQHFTIVGGMLRSD